MSTPRARIGLVGLSGYAEELADVLLSDQRHPEGTTALRAFYAIEAMDRPDRVAHLIAQGARQHTLFEDLIADDSLDAIWLPVPIHLHRALGTKVLNAGRALILEKPVAGCVADHLALAKLAAAKSLPVYIGFQDVYVPGTAQLKRLFLAGEFGQPRVAVVHGSWPRTDRYFKRNPSAGMLVVDGVTVNDSPLTNAMAHFVNLALFLLGDQRQTATLPAAVEAHLARAYDIASFDTCSIRVHLEQSGVELIINLTHAAGEELQPTIEIDTDRGTLRWTFDGASTFQRANTQGVKQLTAAEPPRPHMVRTIGARLLNSEPGNHYADLTNSLGHTTLIEKVHSAAHITTISNDRCELPSNPEHEPRNVIGLANAISKAAAMRRTLAEIGFDF